MGDWNYLERVKQERRKQATIEFGENRKRMLHILEIMAERGNCGAVDSCAWCPIGDMVTAVRPFCSRGDITERAVQRLTEIHMEEALDA